MRCYPHLHVLATDGCFYNDAAFMVCFNYLIVAGKPRLGTIMQFLHERFVHVSLRENVVTEIYVNIYIDIYNILQ